MCDTKGVIYKGRTEGMNPYKERFARGDEGAHADRRAAGRRRVLRALPGQLRYARDGALAWPTNPIVFALANPDPEIAYEVAMAARPDAIVATGRSDYPNQVNNVLGFRSFFAARSTCAPPPSTTR